MALIPVRCGRTWGHRKIQNTARDLLPMVCSLNPKGLALLVGR
jgi:hypothetical protein